SFDMDSTRHPARGEGPIHRIIFAQIASFAIRKGRPFRLVRSRGNRPPKMAGRAVALAVQSCTLTGIGIGTPRNADDMATPPSPLPSRRRWSWFALAALAGIGVGVYLLFFHGGNPPVNNYVLAMSANARGVGRMERFEYPEAAAEFEQ